MSKARILLIDDDDLIRKSVEALLKKSGFAVTIAADGYDALDSAGQSDFDLIICDLRMPGMNGIDTLKGLRKIFDSSGKKKVPEIVLTGYADQDMEKEVRQMKIKRFIYKPFELDDFLEAVKEAVT